MKPRSLDPSSRKSRKASAWRLISPNFAWALGTVLLTSLSLMLVMRLWEADLRVPFIYVTDSLFYLMLVKGVLRHGWWLENPDIGAPFGQELYDFPSMVGDGFHFMLIKLLGVFSSDPALVLNLFFLLSSLLIALASFLVLRQLGISGGTALVCSVIYTLTPYHFLRGEGHLLLSAYYSVPVAAYLVLRLLSGKPLFKRRIRAGSRVLAWASGRSLVTLALCLLVASSGSVYYTVFTVLLLIAATILILVTQRNMRTFIQGAIPVGVMLGFLALNSLPILMYESTNGPNNDTFASLRAPAHSEVFGLRLVQMILPAQGHPIDVLSDLAYNYYYDEPPAKPPGTAGQTGIPSRNGNVSLVGEGSLQAIGFVASLGFAWLLLVALASCLSPRWRVDNLLHRQLATATVIAFLIGTTGGISAIFAELISSSIRGWNRISIFIAFFAVVAVALLLDALRERIRARQGRPVLVGALLSSVLLIGLYDQWNDTYVPNYSGVTTEYSNDEVFVKEIDNELSPQAEVFQLPYMPFLGPKPPPPHKMNQYDLLRPYLHESDLRWSYGAVKGRITADWQEALADTPTEDLLPAVSAVGFDGIYIDRFGYPDGAAKLESELGDLLEVEPLVSPNGRMSFFSLLPYKERMESQYSPKELAALKTATLSPISASFGEGFWPAEQAGKSSLRWMKRTGYITVHNPSEKPRRAVIEMSLTTGSAQESTVTASFPDGTTEQLEIAPEGANLQRKVWLQPGANEVTLETDATLTQPTPDDPRDELALQVIDPVIKDIRYKIGGIIRDEEQASSR